MLTLDTASAQPGPGTIQPTRPADLPALKSVIDATGLFDGALLDSMIAEHFSADGQSGQIWLTYATDKPVGLVYCAPERMTDGTWNMYLIAVHPEHQRRAIGSGLVHHLEHMLAAIGARVLLVETSALTEFQPTRDFYLARGYGQEARIRNFYQAGEDKIVFLKSLATPPAA